MRTTNKMLAFGALLAPVLMAATPANAQIVELVTNGGFETGDFSGFTQGGNLGFTGVTNDPVAVQSGTFGAFLGPVGSVGTLSQTLSTVAGETYSISFGLKTSTGTPNTFQAYFDGLLLEFNNLNANIPYVTYTFSRAVTSNSTSIDFIFQQDPSFWYLDNVSVLGLNSAPAVPEPATWAMLLIGFGLVGGAMRYRRGKTAVSFA